MVWFQKKFLALERETLTINIFNFQQFLTRVFELVRMANFEGLFLLTNEIPGR